MRVGLCSSVPDMNASPKGSYDGITRPGLRRRTFLGRAMAAVTAMVLPEIFSLRAWGSGNEVIPSNRITVGLIGKGLMGGGHLERITNDSAFQMLAVCDVDQTRRTAG